MQQDIITANELRDPQRVADHINALRKTTQRTHEDLDNTVGNMDGINKAVKEILNNDRITLQALVNDRPNVAKDRDNIQQLFVSNKQIVQAHNDLQQWVINGDGRIAALEAQSQEERARRSVVDNQIQHLQGRLQEVTQAQAAVIQAKVKIAQLELQNNIQFKSYEVERQAQDTLKQQFLNLAQNLDKFQLTFENDKKEAKSKWNEDALKIAQLRAKIAGGEVPKAVAVAADEKVPDQIQMDPMIREIEKDMAESKERIALPGGNEVTLELLEKRTELLARLQEEQKVKRERLSQCMISLNMKMEQLTRSYEAFREMAKHKETENTKQIAQLGEEKEMKRQRSLKNLKS